MPPRSSTANRSRHTSSASSRARRIGRHRGSSPISLCRLAADRRAVCAGAMALRLSVVCDPGAQAPRCAATQDDASARTSRAVVASRSRSSDASPRADEVAAYIDGNGAIVSVAWETECPSSSGSSVSHVARRRRSVFRSARDLRTVDRPLHVDVWRRHMGTPTIATNTGTGQFATHGPHHFRGSVRDEPVRHVPRRAGVARRAERHRGDSARGHVRVRFDSGFFGRWHSLRGAGRTARRSSRRASAMRSTIDTVPRSVLGKIYSMNGLPEAQILSWAVYEA